MLFFELFPLFMLVASLIVGAWLVAAHRQAARDEADEIRSQSLPTTEAAAPRTSHRAVDPSENG
ncbi:hypothetical protein D3C83_49370 [compost metagenome]